MNFSLCFDANYAKYALGTIYHLYEKNWRDAPSVEINLLFSEDVPTNIRDAWTRFADDSPGLVIREAIVPGSLDRSLEALLDYNEEIPQISIAAFYRLFLQDFFDNQKTIYLDVDTLPWSSATDMWELALDGKALGAVEDISLAEKQYVHAYAYSEVCGGYDNERFFSTGVLLLDLDIMSKTNTLDALKKMHSTKGLLNHDMTYLNDMYGESALWLPSRFHETDLAYSYGTKPLPHDTVFQGFMFTTKPWGKEGAHANKYADRHSKYTFIDGMNYVLKRAGLETVSWGQFQK